MALSPAQVAQYHELGYVCVEGVLSAIELETARAITDEFVELSREVSVDATATVVVPPVGSAGVHAEGVAAAQDALQHFDLEPGHTREAPQVRRLSNPCSYHTWFDGLMRDDRILDIDQLTALDPDGNTPLHVLLGQDRVNIELVQLLLTAGP